jgi:alkylation response protein AidB-like acyl-CoA dehydrogenase
VPELFASLTPEQRDFRSAVHGFVTSRGGSAELRRTMATAEGHDPAVWRQMADQLGLQALTIPERYGGGGFGSLEAAIVFEELGRALLGSPYLAGYLATSLLLAIGDERACRELLPLIADGRLVAAALCDASGRCEPQAIGVRAAESGDEEHLLTGVSSFVLDGAIADTILVIAQAPPGKPRVFAVAGGAQRLECEPLVTLDPTRRLARLTFVDTPGRAIGPPEGAWPAVRHSLDLAFVALAAESVGATEALLQMSVSYARTRHQFGRAIGSFQAIKHKCADMLVALEAARSAAGHAAWVAAEEPQELPGAAAMAMAYCVEAFVQAAKTTIQIHGGIGFTWEHDAHLYLRRAKTTQLLFGGPAHHREVLAESIGIGTGAWRGNG